MIKKSLKGYEFYTQMAYLGINWMFTQKLGWIAKITNQIKKSNLNRYIIKFIHGF
jgi:hypothetical protein